MSKPLTSDEAFDQWVNRTIEVSSTFREAITPGIRGLLKLAWLESYQQGYSDGYNEGDEAGYDRATPL